MTDIDRLYYDDAVEDFESGITGEMDFCDRLEVLGFSPTEIVAELAETGK